MQNRPGLRVELKRSRVVPNFRPWPPRPMPCREFGRELLDELGRQGGSIARSTVHIQKEPHTQRRVGRQFFPQPLEQVPAVVNGIADEEDVTPALLDQGVDDSLGVAGDHAGHFRPRQDERSKAEASAWPSLRDRLISPRTSAACESVQPFFTAVSKACMMGMTRSGPTICPTTWLDSVVARGPPRRTLASSSSCQASKAWNGSNTLMEIERTRHRGFRWWEPPVNDRGNRSAARTRFLKSTNTHDRRSHAGVGDHARAARAMHRSDRWNTAGPSPRPALGNRRRIVAGIALEGQQLGIGGEFPGISLAA